MDCAQLEQSPTASRYNLLDNGDFHSAAFWYSSVGQLTTSDTSAAPELDGNVYSIIGEPRTAKTVYQTVYVKGNAGDSSWGDLLTAYDGKTITYDQIGNPLTYGSYSYTWEHGRQLKTLSDGTTTWTYTYDADGIRSSVSDGTTTNLYTYTGGQLTMMRRKGITMYFTYDATGRLQTMTYGTTTLYYLTNLQGDVIGLVNSSGQRVVSYTYDAWGNLLSATGNAVQAEYNPLRYRGYVYDTETGLYYLQSRYYDPEIGRFLNADAFASTGQGLLGNNMFAYCGNNPVIYCDPCGTCKHDIYYLGLADCPKCRDEENAGAFQRYMNQLYDHRASLDQTNRIILEEQAKIYDGAFNGILESIKLLQILIYKPTYQLRK